MAKKNKHIAKLGHNANYDYKQHAPKTPMGSGDFANMPSAPIFASFSGQTDLRSGIPNNQVMSVDLLSHVDENMCEHYDHD